MLGLKIKTIYIEFLMNSFRQCSESFILIFIFTGLLGLMLFDHKKSICLTINKIDYFQGILNIIDYPIRSRLSSNYLKIKTAMQLFQGVSNKMPGRNARLTISFRYHKFKASMLLSCTVILDISNVLRVVGEVLASC